MLRGSRPASLLLAATIWLGMATRAAADDVRRASTIGPFRRRVPRSASRHPRCPPASSILDRARSPVTSTSSGSWIRMAAARTLRWNACRRSSSPLRARPTPCRSRSCRCPSAARVRSSSSRERPHGTCWSDCPRDPSPLAASLSSMPTAPVEGGVPSSGPVPGTTSSRSTRRFALPSSTTALSILR